MAKCFDIEQKHLSKSPELKINKVGLESIIPGSDPMDLTFLSFFRIKELLTTEDGNIDGFEDNFTRESYEEAFYKNKLIRQMIVRYSRSGRKTLSAIEIREIRKFLNQKNFKEMKMVTTAQENTSWEKLFGGEKWKNI